MLNQTTRNAVTGRNCGTCTNQNARRLVQPSIAAASDVWAVRQAVDALPPASREVIRLAHMEQLTQPEIAARLDVPLGTVKSRTHTAYRQLASALSASYEMS